MFGQDQGRGWLGLSLIHHILGCRERSEKPKTLDKGSTAEKERNGGRHNIVPAIAKASGYNKLRRSARSHPIHPLEDSENRPPPSR